MLKTGIIQFNPTLGEPERNISKLKELISRARGTHLIVIPELANSGYNFESRKQAFVFSEEIQHSNFADFLISEARDKNLFIVSGFIERQNEQLYNSALLVSPKGLIGLYRKIHLFMNEKDIFDPGDAEPEAYDIGLCKAGMLICFDWMFPELWRILGLKNADIICHPSNLVLPHAQQAVPVHGMINRTYVLTANRTGTEKNLTFTGQSFISDPKGEVLCMASKDKDEVLLAEIDLKLSQDKMITPRNHAFCDRKPALYKSLIQLSKDH